MGHHLHNLKVPKEINDLNILCRIKCVFLFGVILIAHGGAQCWVGDYINLSFGVCLFGFLESDFAQLLSLHQIVLDLLGQSLVYPLFEHLEHADFIKLICKPHLSTRGRSFSAFHLNIFFR